MKKLIPLICCFIVLTACNSNKKDTAKTTTDTVTADKHSAKARQSDADTTVNNIGTDRTTGK
jgi:hypothetical protein